jgi:hypothetical protein
MLDVHPRHESVHTWRDFFIHIATIVIGLLIAVGLEQSVEWLHRRHQIHAARERIHEEVLVNQRILLEDDRRLERIVAHLDHNLALVHSREGKYPTPAETLDFSFGLQGFYDAAYTNARDGGTLSLMPYEEAAMYSDAYSGNALAQEGGIELWKQLFSAKSALHGKTLSELDLEEIQPLAAAISEARGRAEHAHDLFEIQRQEWDALLSGHFRNDIGSTGQ